MGAQNQTSTGCGCGCGCSGTDASSICKCEGTSGCAWTITNLPGLPSIAYRVGDFGSFRQAMLLPSALDPVGETYLEGWRPTAGTDLALQIIDWWAYVAEVLTFYTERIANESYLGTAMLPESVSRLVSLLGYRPRPGIGATATLGVLAAGPGSITLPAGFQVSSKAAPGVAPQTFELGQTITIAAPTSVPTPPAQNAVPTTNGTAPPANTPPGSAAPPSLTALIVRGGVLVKGKPTSIAVGDRLLLVPNDYASEADDLTPAVVAVTGLAQETDPYGKVNTRVLLDGAGELASTLQAADYRLCRSTIANHLITVPAGAQVVSTDTLYLDSTARSIKAGDPVLIDTPGAATGPGNGSGFDIVQVTGYAEVLWYANASYTTPTTSPGSNGIPLLIAQLTVQSDRTSDIGANYSNIVSSVTVRSGWTDVGTLLDTPVAQVAGLPSAVSLSQAPAAAVGTAVTALIEDTNGAGGMVSATPLRDGRVALAPGAAVAASSATGRSTASGLPTILLYEPPTDNTAAAVAAGLPASLQPPLRLLWDLISVSRGATVANENLGTGDATQAGQNFKLQKSPVTYLADTATGAAPPGAGATGAGSRSGPGYSSTVQLAVDGMWWTEVPMFFGHGPTETIFVTREDESGSTHILTGDGINGARLRTGATVTATYRVGSGAAVPPAGTLTQVLSPQTNLSALRNPATAGGGADPDSSALLSTLAPASVLTFGRAISGDDYEVVAAQAPGVTRAGAVWAWDEGEQRALTVVYVGDGEGAVASARAALKAEADPNRPVRVRLAIPLSISLQMTLEVAANYVIEDVVAAARAALLNPPGSPGRPGLFTPGVLAIGETLYRSRIESVCAVPGVVAIRRLRLRQAGWHLAAYEWLGTDLRDANGPRFTPGEGGYFNLSADQLIVDAEVSTSE